MTILALLVTTADHLAKRGVFPSDKADMWLTHAIKTQAHYQRVMWAAVKDLYNGAISESGFEDVMLQLIDGQLTRAWNEGMRHNGLDPATDMAPEWSAILDEIKLSEIDFVGRIAGEIIEAAQAGTGYEELRSRVDLWAARYNDVLNRSILETAGGGNFEWIVGDTEHCETCLSLNGIVASLADWKTAGFKPQSDWRGALPNRFLKCSGFRCGCKLAKTNKRKSPKALNTLLNIGTEL